MNHYGRDDAFSHRHIFGISPIGSLLVLSLAHAGQLPTSESLASMPFVAKEASARTGTVPALNCEVARLSYLPPICSPSLDAYLAPRNLRSAFSTLLPKFVSRANLAPLRLVRCPCLQSLSVQEPRGGYSCTFTGCCFSVLHFVLFCFIFFYFFILFFRL